MSNQSIAAHVRPGRAFTDNYIWLIDVAAGARPVVAVDPGDAAPCSPNSSAAAQA